MVLSLGQYSRMGVIRSIFLNFVQMMAKTGKEYRFSSWFSASSQRHTRIIQPNDDESKQNRKLVER